ncbi:hypothetical protein PHYBLDRAFT_169577 [Phycomyces blakesleeanus NRRL 1555(-)]|uniref:Uncharacterized protein n=1 Tax=Phycomyces blakesleeanus (strain ATCC 8743b / DSM 1359 / FGSC 10004 / NBRC 33097 / NRRL 1555) TaxID=763407 RepID=A0A163DN00_PHYB8|nr:hypothetical protein PHYBLDRAFT_169577 [Phycomyces blakesleeanus NRRL 1555(-)]OAD72450.1 hypothetical protein PHYBLDRAFT_169577 [Phycomyces blakesleeanus NRRL 1555(-)]|eukprot:XP_018290490.1 hypothetical protein PHYBLDRAFT_169577 [Phycomyces blakesleeanus NRRL 1555(-)]
MNKPEKLCIGTWTWIEAKLRTGTRLWIRTSKSRKAKFIKRIIYYVFINCGRVYILADLKLPYPNGFANNCGACISLNCGVYSTSREIDKVRDQMAYHIAIEFTQENFWL